MRIVFDISKYEKSRVAANTARPARPFCGGLKRRFSVNFGSDTGLRWTNPASSRCLQPELRVPTMAEIRKCHREGGFGRLALRLHGALSGQEPLREVPEPLSPETEDSLY